MSPHTRRSVRPDGTYAEDLITATAPPSADGRAARHSRAGAFCCRCRCWTGQPAWNMGPWRWCYGCADTFTVGACAGAIGSCALMLIAMGWIL